MEEYVIDLRKLYDERKPISDDQMSLDWFSKRTHPQIPHIPGIPGGIVDWEQLVKDFSLGDKKQIHEGGRFMGGLKQKLGGKKDKEDSKTHTTDLLYEVWIPKWKRFQPPMWTIFRWAYNIKRILFTGVIPISIKTSTTGESIQRNSDGSYSIEINGKKYQSPIIDMKAKELLGSLGGTNHEK